MVVVLHLAYMTDIGGSRLHTYFARDSHPVCKPKQQVMYLKVFKTGSSTLQNVFYRYAWYNNLTIVPALRDPYKKMDFELNFVPKSYRHHEKFDLFPEHIYNFSKDKILSFMPENTTFIASV